MSRKAIYIDRHAKCILVGGIKGMEMPIHLKLLSVQACNSKSSQRGCSGANVVIDSQRHCKV